MRGERSLFRAVTPVSICLASLSKVTRIVLFGLQKLTIHRTKRGGGGGGRGFGKGGLVGVKKADNVFKMSR